MSLPLWSDDTFNPGSIAGLMISLDARQTSTLLDTSDAIISVDNTAVKTWNDTSGNANHFTQGTANNRPVWLTNVINGLPALSFFPGANVSNLTATDSASMNYTQFYTAGVVVRKEVKVANERIWGKWTVTGNLREHSLVVNFSDVFVGMGMVSPDSGGAATLATSASTFAINTPAIIEFWYDGSALFIFRNGTQIATQALASINNSTGNYMLGSRDGLAEPFEGYIGAFRAWNVLPTASQRLANRQDLARTWGITIA